MGVGVNLTDVKTISLSWAQTYKGLNKITASGTDGRMTLWIEGKDLEGHDINTLASSISIGGTNYSGAYEAYDPAHSVFSPDPPLANVKHYFNVEDFSTAAVVLIFCNSSGGGSSSWWRIANLTMTIEELIPG